MNKKVTQAVEHQANEKLKSVLNVISCIEKAGLTENSTLKQVKEVCEITNEGVIV